MKKLYANLKQWAVKEGKRHKEDIDLMKVELNHTFEAEEREKLRKENFNLTNEIKRQNENFITKVEYFNTELSAMNEAFQISQENLEKVLEEKRILEEILIKARKSTNN